MAGLVKRGLVLGDAACVERDIEAALELSEFDGVAACNNMIVHWRGHLDYAVTLHPEPCENWVGIQEAMRIRERNGLNRPSTWTGGIKGDPVPPGFDRIIPEMGGSSGLLCLKVMLINGFDRVVLCGMPMTTDGAHFYERTPWVAAPNFRKGWHRNQAVLRETTRSMSGWTAQLLGRPDMDWLAGVAGE